MGLRSVTVYDSNNTKLIAKNPEPNSAYLRPSRTEKGAGFASQKTDLVSKKQLSVVQEKKIRDFMMKKKKLLSEVTKA